MGKASHRAEVDELVGRLLDGAELTSHEGDRLQSLLLQDPELLDQFVLTAALANDLQQVASLAVSADGEPGRFARAPHATLPGVLSRSLGVSLLALAASFVMVALSMATLLRGAADRPPAPTVRPEYVATVVSQEGWAQSTTYPAGSRIPTGEFTLESGVVQLLLDSGPNLLIEGPACLDLKSDSQARLAYGKLVFRDDSGGDPFYLSTPWSELTDLGTEYAVSIHGDEEEVHVFSGAVERTGVSEGDPKPTELLKDGQAMRYRRNVATPVESLATEPVKFVREVARDAAQPGQPSAVYEGFIYQDESVFERGRANRGRGWAGPWRGSFLDPTVNNRSDRSLVVSESLVFKSKSTSSQGKSLGHVGYWLAHRNLAEPIDLAANQVVYLSFLYRPEGMWKKGENNLKVMFYNPNEGVIEHRIAIALDAGRGLIRGALCGARKECPLPMADGATYLVAAKVACSADNPDQLMVRIFQPGEPVSTHEPASWTVVTPTIDSDDSLCLMSLHFSCVHEQTIDEIRIGDTWASVTGPWAKGKGLAQLQPVAAASE